MQKQHKHISLIAKLAIQVKKNFKRKAIKI